MKKSMAFLTEQGRYLGRLEPAFSKNCVLREAQYKKSFSEEKSLEAARCIIGGKLANQRTYLVRGNRTRRTERLGHAIKKLKMMERKLCTVDNIPSLLGFEGTASSFYLSESL